MTHVEHYIKTLQCPNCGKEHEVDIVYPIPEPFKCSCDKVLMEDLILRFNDNENNFIDVRLNVYKIHKSVLDLLKTRIKYNTLHHSCNDVTKSFLLKEGLWSEDTITLIQNLSSYEDDEPLQPFAHSLDSNIIIKLSNDNPKQVS